MENHDEVGICSNISPGPAHGCMDMGSGPNGSVIRVLYVGDEPERDRILNLLERINTNPELLRHLNIEMITINDIEVVEHRPGGVRSGDVLLRECAPVIIADKIEKGEIWFDQSQRRSKREMDRYRAKHFRKL